jgi:hypothetical protein
MVMLMSISEGVITLGVAGISLVVSVALAFINRENEHRFTTLEHSVLTKEECDKLMDTCFKMNMVWDFYEKQLPLLLKNPEEMDPLFDKASKDILSLEPSEVSKLVKYLKEQVSSSNDTRRYWAGVYLSVLQSRMVEKKC